MVFNVTTKPVDLVQYNSSVIYGGHEMSGNTMLLYEYTAAGFNLHVRKCPEIRCCCIPRLVSIHVRKCPEIRCCCIPRLVSIHVRKCPEIRCCCVSFPDFTRTQPRYNAMSCDYPQVPVPLCLHASGRDKPSLKASLSTHSQQQKHVQAVVGIDTASVCS